VVFVLHDSWVYCLPCSSMSFSCEVRNFSISLFLLSLCQQDFAFLCFPLRLVDLFSSPFSFYHFCRLFLVWFSGFPGPLLQSHSSYSFTLIFFQVTWPDVILGDLFSPLRCPHVHFAFSPVRMTQVFFPFVFSSPFSRTPPSFFFCSPLPYTLVSAICPFPNGLGSIILANTLPPLFPLHFHCHFSSQ